MLIGITGATGFVGLNLTKEITRFGEVIEIRSINGKEKYRLNFPSNIAIVKPQILIHLAISRSYANENGHDENLLGLQRIVEESKENKEMIIIYLSSLSSHSSSASKYGRSKFNCEEFLKNVELAYIVRAGLISAVPPGGFDARLRKIANMPLVLPSISNLYIHVTHIQQITNAIEAILDYPFDQKLKSLIIAKQEPVSLTNYLLSVRKRFKFATIEVSLTSLLRLVRLGEKFVKLQLFDSIKSYSTNLEVRDFVWKS